MKPLTMALSFVLVLNVFMFLFQTSIINVGGNANFFNLDNSILGRAIDDNSIINNTQLEDLPSAIEGTSPDTDSSFTDLFKTIRNWIFDVSGLGFIIDILNVPVTFLTMMGVAKEISLSVGALWWLLNFFLIISTLLLGRE